jgi:hypothetical protein
MNISSSSTCICCCFLFWVFFWSMCWFFNLYLVSCVSYYVRIFKIFSLYLLHLVGWYWFVYVLCILFISLLGHHGFSCITTILASCIVVVVCNFFFLDYSFFRATYCCQVVFNFFNFFVSCVQVSFVLFLFCKFLMQVFMCLQFPIAFYIK